MEPEETIHAFSKRLDVPYSIIYSILTGRTRIPSEKTIERIANKLGSTPAYLRYRQGPRENGGAECRGE